MDCGNQKVHTHPKIFTCIYYSTQKWLQNIYSNKYLSHQALLIGRVYYEYESTPGKESPMTHKMSTLKTYFNFSSTNCASPLRTQLMLRFWEERGILLFISLLKVVGNEKEGGVKKVANDRKWLQTAAIEVCLPYKSACCL